MCHELEGMSAVKLKAAFMHDYYECLSVDFLERLGTKSNFFNNINRYCPAERFLFEGFPDQCTHPDQPTFSREKMERFFRVSEGGAIRNSVRRQERSFIGFINDMTWAIVRSGIETGLLSPSDFPDFPEEPSQIPDTSTIDTFREYRENNMVNIILAACGAGAYKPEDWGDEKLGKLQLCHIELYKKLRRMGYNHYDVTS